MVRPGRRALGLSMGALLLFAVGTNVQAGWLIVLASLLFGAVLVGVILPPFMVRGVGVERRAPAEAFQGDEVPVDLVVVGARRGLRLSLAVRDPNLGPATAFVPVLRPKERVTITSRRPALRRGMAEARPLTVSSAAPFGVARASRRAASTATTMVYPRVVPIRRLSLLEASARDAGAMLVSRRGTGQDYLGIREYRVGDSMRHVHWPSTARTGALMVREFEQERRSCLGIVVDTSADDGRVQTPLDLCCAVAASVAVAAMDAGHPVSLAASTAEGTDVLEPGDRTAALVWLATLRRSPGRPFADVLAEAGQALSGRDAFVVVFPTWKANALASLGHVPWPATGPEGGGPGRLAAAVVDASTFARTRRSPDVLAPASMSDLEAGLRSRGVDVVRIDAKEDLGPCLDRLLSPAA